MNSPISPTDRQLFIKEKLISGDSCRRLEIKDTGSKSCVALGVLYKR